VAQYVLITVGKCNSEKGWTLPRIHYCFQEDFNSEDGGGIFFRSVEYLLVRLHGVISEETTI
jgi:hypothetical protein